MLRRNTVLALHPRLPSGANAKGSLARVRFTLRYQSHEATTDRRKSRRTTLDDLEPVGVNRRPAARCWPGWSSSGHVAFF
jgi:hypothetical protein